jgi:hypothetical protein
VVNFPPEWGADFTGMSTFNVADGFLFRFALADAAGKAGAFGDEIAVFARIDDNLSHVRLPCSEKRITGFRGKIKRSCSPQSENFRNNALLGKISFIHYKTKQPKIIQHLYEYLE